MTEDPEPTFDVCIRVLGPIEATGNHDGAAMKPRPKSLDMAVLLALHRPGYTAAQIKGFLWPKGDPYPSTFHAAVSGARAWLRRVADENLIPYAADDQPGAALADAAWSDVAGGMARYLLAPCVGTDWDRFQWLERNARGAAAADRLTEALALVRGEPLAGKEWGWALLDTSKMCCAIGDAAHRLAQLRLETNDVSGARAAARAGLQGSPWDQLLYGDLMEASSMGGDPEGVEEARRELVALLGGEDLEIRFEVEAIYQRCRKQHAT